MVTTAKHYARDLPTRPTTEGWDAIYGLGQAKGLVVEAAAAAIITATVLGYAAAAAAGYSPFQRDILVESWFHVEH